MATIAERIKEALHTRGMKQSELVEKTGIGKSSISTYLSGSYEPKQRNLYKMAKALEVDVDWLMGNDVPMETKNEVLNSYEIANLINKVRTDVEVQELLKLYYNDLSDENKKRVIELVKALGGH